MNIKTTPLIKCVFISSFLVYQTATCMMEDIPPLDDIEISSDKLAAGLAAYEKANPTNMFSLRQLSPGLLAAGLLEANIEKPLWNHTKAPAGRDILYLLPYKITSVEHGGFALNFFYNFTDDMKVTINDIFNFLPNSNQLALIDGIIASYIPQAAGERAIQQLLPLFKKITIQEHKSGIFWQSAFIKGPVSLQINTSLQIGARNFWLNKTDELAIRAVFRNEFGGSEVREREFYKIRFGMGDTRIKFGLNTINMTSFQNDVGIETIVPTSRLAYTPKVNIGLAQAKFNIDELSQKAFQSLYGIRDYLVNPRLGIGHWGVGCFLEEKIGIFHELAHLWVRASYDYLFPSDEDRLFMFKQTMTVQDLNFPPGTPDATKIARVDQYTQQYLFPSSFKASVKPGGIANIVAALNINFTKRWGFALGYDFYTQQRETIQQLYNTSVDMLSLRVQDAQSPSVTQNKLFLEILYTKKAKNKDFGVGFGGDYTITSKNIGQDMTLYFKIISSF